VTSDEVHAEQRDGCDHASSTGEAGDEITRVTDVSAVISTARSFVSPVCGD
jgi:hypothetical protein